MLETASTITSNPLGFGLAFSCIAAALLGGCVPMHDAVPERGDIFAPLHSADLAGFEYQLAIDTHAGRDDGWTDVGNALLELANCEPISATFAPPLESSPSARVVYELVRLEDSRRLRLLRQVDTSDDQWAQDTLHSRWASPNFFERTAGEFDDELIQWPHVEEHWPDEWPAEIDVDHRCDQLQDRRRTDPIRPPFDTIDPDGLTGHLVEEWLQTQRVRRAIDAVDEQSELSFRARQTLTAHRADVALALRERDDAVEVASSAVDDTARRALGELRAIGNNAELDDETRVVLWHRSALLAIELDETEHALEALDELIEYAPSPISDMARYYAVMLTWFEGRWEEAADYGSQMIDGPTRVESAYAYFAATAHRHDGREDSFLGLARDALRDHRRADDDPFLGALYRQVLRELARYEVDERTEELLEEFGPRAGLSIRKREFAEIALDMGRPGVAEQMVQPLLAETQDARQLPRLYAILALAAFMRDDRDDFDRHVHRLIDRPQQLLQAIPRNRRAAFFARRDAELARVLRATLPLMAEWGDSPGIRATRQSWLEAIVEHTQSFLRQVPESIVSSELAELYELAGQLLEDHPRGYAQRVGSQQPDASALVLGTIDMPPAPPLDEAPRPRVSRPPLQSLLLIPYGEVPPAEFRADIDAASNGGDSP